jgi:hypothetical protein
MTGRYRISMVPLLDNGTPRNWESEKRTARRWRLFTETCRSLAADGLDYAVTFALTGDSPHIVITATGTAKPRKQAAAHHLKLPPPVPAQRCRDRALEVSWFLAENRERRKDGTAYWRKHQARYKELSVMAEDYLRGELEYWRELESLSGQRQQFKPGRTDETANADDEVAA